MLSGLVSGREPVQKRRPEACRKPGTPNAYPLTGGDPRTCAAAQRPDGAIRRSRYDERRMARGENAASPAVTHRVLLNGTQAARHI